jgi:hypothetical protein
MSKKAVYFIIVLYLFTVCLKFQVYSISLAFQTQCTCEYISVQQITFQLLHLSCFALQSYGV